MTQAYSPGNTRLWHWVDFTGPDAQDFLHRITTVNVRGLESGEGARGCLLTAQGKFRAFFTLWNTAPAAYAFEFEGGRDDLWLKELLATIDQMTFAEKVTIGAPSQLSCTWIFDEIPGLTPNHTLLRDGIRFSHHGSRSFGAPWITAWGNSEVAANLSDLEIESWRIAALDARVDHEITPNVNPLEVGVVDAVAVNKGCYPGQEVIEKIAALGSPAKRLVLIEGEGLPPLDSAILANDTEVGRLTSVTKTETGFRALGFVRKTHAKENLEIHFENDVKGMIKRIAPYA